MPSAQRHILQLLMLLAAAATCFLTDISAAYAQANACLRLEAMLSELDRNADFRGSQGNNDELRLLQRQVQQDESRYVREGCNDDAKAGRRLTPECRQLARIILQGRQDVEDLSRSVQTGNAVSGQREAILQEMLRFNCQDRSRASVQRDRGNLFDRLFDVFGNTQDGYTRGDDFNPFGNYHTVRTLCVRKTDGFYWPISYSTLVDYVANDAETCRTQCPALDVDLYYYDNPGQEPEQMINEWGEPYASMPNAFKFRTEFDTTSKCQSTQDVGQVAMADLPDGAGARAMVTFRGETFPLPVRDPRGYSRVIAAPLAVASAEYVNVPLPRRRPGQEPVAVAVPVGASRMPPTGSSSSPASGSG